MATKQKTKTEKETEESKNPIKAVSKTTATSSVKGNKLALILIRGLKGMRKDIKVALYTLRLRKKHACVVIENRVSNRVAALKCKDYIAYGEIDDATLKMLLEKRGKKDPYKKGHLKKFFSLHPPKGGFERKGIKTPFKQGGALGYRGARINDLIRKML